MRDSIMILTRRGLIVLLVPSLVVIGGAYVPGLSQTALGIFAGLLAVIVIDNIHSRRSVSVEVRREVGEKLSLGARNKVGLHVGNRSRRQVTCDVKDDPPIEFTTPERTRRVRLAPYAKAEVAYHTTPRARGLYSFGDIHVRGVSWLGLSFWLRRFPAATEVAVYPNMLELSHYENLSRASHLREYGIRHIRRWGRGTDFESLRDYVPDDEFRVIDWKATGRRGKPIARQYAIERSQNVILMVDAGRMMSALIGEMSKLDYAVNAVLMLAHVAVEQGDAVGLVGFSDTVRSYIPPRKGRGQVGRIVEALYDLKPELVESDYARAFELLAGRLRKRSLVVCFTDLVDSDASARLMAHLGALSPRHLPLLVTLRDSVLEQAARSIPRETFAAYTRTVAAQVLYDREIALRELQQRGGLVLDSTPGQLTVDSINRYLALKQQGRL